MKLMMMKEIFSGMLGTGASTGSSSDASANMIPMLMIGNMLSGNKDNELGNCSEMFDLDLDSDDTEDSSEKDE